MPVYLAIKEGDTKPTYMASGMKTLGKMCRVSERTVKYHINNRTVCKTGYFFTQDEYMGTCYSICQNPECQKIFVLKKNGQLYCSQKCGNRAWKLKNVKKWKERDKTVKFPEALSRPFTLDTVYLCHKWHMEGMKVREIAGLLERSEENVQKALDTLLKKGEMEVIRKYLVPRTKG